MIDLEDWLNYTQHHKLLFKFKGLGGMSWRRCNFYPNIKEAALADERFVESIREEEHRYYSKKFSEAVAQKDNSAEYLSQFCDYVESRITHRQWKRLNLPEHAAWASAPLDSIMAVVTRCREKFGDGFVSEWLADEDASCAVEAFAGEDFASTLLNKHPLEAVWSHAREEGVAVSDVFFICPACRGEPQTEVDLRRYHVTQNGYPVFYCASCGSEMTVGREENILDFFNSLEVTPYPFDLDKQRLWLRLMADRKAWCLNKLELKVGDLVHIKVSEVLDSYSSPGEKWTHWKDEPGALVRVTSVTDTGIGYEEDENPENSGGIEFEKLYGRPA